MPAPCTPASVSNAPAPTLKNHARTLGSIAAAEKPSTDPSESPTYAMSSQRCGSICCSKYSNSDFSRILAAMINGNPTRRATRIARCAPFSGAMRPRNNR